MKTFKILAHNYCCTKGLIVTWNQHYFMLPIFPCLFSPLSYCPTHHYHDLQCLQTATITSYLHMPPTRAQAYTNIPWKFLWVPHPKPPIQFCKIKLWNFELLIFIVFYMCQSISINCLLLHNFVSHSSSLHFFAQFFFSNLIYCFYGFQGPLRTLMWCIKFQLWCLNFTQPIYFILYLLQGCWQW